MYSNPNPVIYTTSSHAQLTAPSASLTDVEASDPFSTNEIFDLVRDINDPEHPVTLEQLHVVRPEHIYFVQDSRVTSSFSLKSAVVSPVSLLVHFTPTIPHCSMATLIGLSIRTKLQRSLPPGLFRVSVQIRPGTHASEAAINRQLADKERVAAAGENQHLRRVVDACIMGPPRSGIAL